MRKIFFISFYLLLAAQLFAQQENLNNSIQPILDEPPVDGYYSKSDIENREIIPYAEIRPGDVVFSKRVWREIDVREKLNRALASPKSRLIDVIMDAVMAGELTAYDPTPTNDDPNGDSFKVRMTPEQVMGKLADSVLVPQFDNEGNEIGSTMMAGEFNPDSVLRFRIKEDWIFDKQRSVFEPRIIGIAPLINISMGGVVLDAQPAFWIYFPEARHIFVNKEVSNRHNDATGISYDDVFTRRIFSSYIVKESNPEDLRIKDYAKGIDKLYESEAIKKTLMDYEQDLWSY